MRRGEKEIKARPEIDAILREARVLRLGLVDGLEPYVVPLSFGYDGEALYFHCATAGRKLDLLQRNPLVCFEVDELDRVVEGTEACRWGVAYRSVIGTGRAVVLGEREEKRKGLEILMRQYSAREHNFDDREMNRTCVVRIDILSVSGKKSPG